MVHPGFECEAFFTARVSSSIFGGFLLIKSDFRGTCFRLANISGRRFELHPELYVTYVLCNRSESFALLQGHRWIGRLPIEGGAHSGRGEL